MNDAGMKFIKPLCRPYETMSIEIDLKKLDCTKELAFLHGSPNIHSLYNEILLRKELLVVALAA